MTKMTHLTLIALVCLLSIWGSSKPRMVHCTDATAVKPPADSTDGRYLAVTGPCGFDFPRDHGPHPGFRTEWWYYTGNLQATSGQRFGFQLTFFRRQISPPGSRQHWPQPSSPWRTDQIYFAHAALSDLSSSRFHQGEIVARGAAGLAGSFQDQNQTNVFVRNWRLRFQGNQHHLQAESDDFGLDLLLEPAKPPVAHGKAGYSRKGSAPESASCYYSITRLAASGQVTAGGKRFTTDGIAWMDHEYSSAPLEPALVGWDWFSVQLSDRSELMIYLIRHQDGSYHPASSGTYSDPDGQTFHLPADAIRVETLDHWTSPDSGARYPHRWRLKIPTQQLDLWVQPQLADQEMHTTRTAGTPYWEGAVAISGTARQETITGVGYVELTGYAGRLRLY